MAKKFKVPAECHSDDKAIECPFDAAAWLKKATLKEIKALHVCGYMGNYPADEVAIWMAGKDEEIAFMFQYIEHKKRAGADIGFECSVDRDAALKWLDKNRNRMYTRLINAMEV
jgi:acylphosphatase